MQNEKSNTGLCYPKLEFPNVFSGFDLNMDPQLKLQNATGVHKVMGMLVK